MPACNKHLHKQDFHLSPETKADLCASLQEAICETLLLKAKTALKKYTVKEIYLAGGVSANKRLKEIFEQHFKNTSIQVKYPHHIKYSVDNAAMIASAAYFCDFEEGFVSLSSHNVSGNKEDIVLAKS